MDDAHKRALVVAYYLSRFDKKGYQSLGFGTWNSAYEGIGAKVGVPPATIKHMRDSFDPYCSPVRKGWHQRPILRSRVQVMEAYADLSGDALYEIVQDILGGKAEATQVYIAPIAATGQKEVGIMGDNLAFAARLRTGEAAEEFFRAQYPTLPQFAGMELEDTRKLGTGFDFRIHGPGMVRAVEVKGVVGKTGSIAFTDKEWSVAHYLKDDYILALVRSLDSVPALELTVDPAAHILATKRSIETVSVYWSAKVWVGVMKMMVKLLCSRVKWRRTIPVNASYGMAIYAAWRGTSHILWRSTRKLCGRLSSSTMGRYNSCVRL